MTRYFGKICAKHPELIGERLTSNSKCVRCHRDKVNNYRKLNPASNIDRRKRYYDNNPEVYTEKTDKRRRNMPTPKWADKRKIRMIYKEARLKGLTVDHIVPLNNQLVCGLHVEYNLRVIPRRDNSSKGNLFKI
jgi:hypothetical protein